VDTRVGCSFVREVDKPVEDRPDDNEFVFTLKPDPDPEIGQYVIAFEGQATAWDDDIGDDRPVGHIRGHRIDLVSALHGDDCHAKALAESGLFQRPADQGAGSGKLGDAVVRSQPDLIDQQRCGQRLGQTVRRLLFRQHDLVGAH